MEDIGSKDKRESTNDKVNALCANLEESGATCDGSLKVSNSSPLVSPNATINMPQGLYNVDVAATFGIPLTIVGDLHLLIKSIEAGKHDELLSGMTNDKRIEIMDALGTICNSIQADNTNADVIHCKVSHVDDLTNLNVDESTMPSDPIVQSVDINTKLKSYAGAVGAGLESVLEGGPWLIRNSPIILKKWSMDTRLLKEELTRIPIWVKLHDVPIQVFEEDEADLVDIVTIGIPSLTEDDFTKETIRVEYEWRLPRCDICKIFSHVHDHCPKKVASPPIVATSNVVTPIVEKTNDGFQTVGKKKKRKGKSKSTNGGQFVGPLVKPNVRYEPKVNTSAPKRRASNVGVSLKICQLIRNYISS
ncbi:zinc knuckle CX2CX4HX4C containing protein [Tanacetum coccineum]|uniref:Zinc knuckle CX2CX4HX4C containing protein n=1 Tax=Tanacetum coccineum TaxID=301880 RepID=A0ABQ5BIU2_9ASTR